MTFKLTEEQANESVQVNSSSGRAASSDNLPREEAMGLYQKIAALV